MKNKIATLTFAALACLSYECDAYELFTHAYATNAAFGGYQLRDRDLEFRYGIELRHSYGPRFFDTLGVQIGPPAERRQMDFDRVHVLKVLRGVPPDSLLGWLITGAVREDDITTAACTALNALSSRGHVECNPQDDPYGNFSRVANHFYDPVFNRGLRSNIADGIEAPNWATGYGNALQDPTIANPGRQNHFTLVDARRSMYYALTGNMPWENSANESTRKAWWATAFRSLGAASHLLQDMAQPQHTRNEPHPSGEFEHFTEARAELEPTYKIDGRVVTPPALRLEFQAPIRRERFGDFWSTAVADGSVMAGRGLADYSNRNFLTERTNLQFQNVPYLRPSRHRDLYGEEIYLGDNFGIPGTIAKFLFYQSDEALIDYSRYPRMTTESAFSDFARRASVYKMSRLNWVDHADVLIPQAIGYTTGLIEYFFRGRINCVTGVSVHGECIVRNYSSEAMDGTIEFFYDDIDGRRLAVPNTRKAFVAESTYRDLNAELLVRVEIPIGFPKAKRPGEYILVFKGKLGKEGGGDEFGAVVGQVVTVHRFLAGGSSAHSLIKPLTGRVFAWGSNIWGETGVGDRDFIFPYGRPGPVLVPSFSDVKEVAKGHWFSLAIKRDGTVWAWGNNQSGELGNGLANFAALNPTRIQGLSKAIAIAGGGSAYIGGGHALAVLEDGRVFSWGNNEAGQLGDGSISSRDMTSVPRAVVGAAGARAVAAGGLHSVALRPDGTVLTWGHNQFGQLGLGSADTNPGTPTPVQPAVSRIKAIAAGGTHTLALKDDGTVWAWGRNTAGQVGNGSIAPNNPGAAPVPTQVVDLTDVVAIAAGELHSVALKQDGSVWAWGANESGQLGIGRMGPSEPRPVRVVSQLKFIEISAGVNHSNAMTDDGDVWSWGSNQIGQLGTGSTGSPKMVPVYSFSMPFL